MSDCEELKMLEVVVVVFERSEGKGESCGCVGFENCSLGEYLEDGHVFSVECLFLLCDPREIEFAL